MAFYPNPNIREENWEAYKKAAQLLGMRSASAVINMIGDSIRVLLKNKEGE